MQQLDISQQLLDRYVLRIYGGPGLDEASDSSTGELTFVVTDGSPGEYLELRPTLRLFSSGAKAVQGYPDRLDLHVRGENVRIEVNGDQTQWPFETQLSGELIDEARLRDPENPERFRLVRAGDDLYAAPEDAIIRVTGQFSGTLSINPTDEMPALYLSDGKIELAGVESGQVIGGRLGLDQRINAPQEQGPPPGGMFFAAGPAALADAPAWDAVRCPRTLPVWIVRFSNNGASTGAGAQDQLDAADRIWKLACITINKVGETTLTNGTLMTSAIVNDITAAYTPPAGVIPLFFVDNELDAHGGGTTTLPGSPLARVVVSDITSGLNALNKPVVNPNLLAHELGHVLGGVHPSENPGVNLWRPPDEEEENILKPSGAPWLPIDKRNPWHNCISAYNVAAEPDAGVAATCVITPDP